MFSHVEILFHLLWVFVLLIGTGITASILFLSYLFLISMAQSETGKALDAGTATEMMEYLQSMNNAGKMVVMVTHDSQMAGYAHRLVTICDGVMTSESIGLA